LRACTSSRSFGRDGFRTACQRRRMPPSPALPALAGRKIGIPEWDDTVLHAVGTNSRLLLGKAMIGRPPFGPTAVEHRSILCGQGVRHSLLLWLRIGSATVRNMIVTSSPRRNRDSSRQRSPTVRGPLEGSWRARCGDTYGSDARGRLVPRPTEELIRARAAVVRSGGDPGLPRRCRSVLRAGLGAAALSKNCHGSSGRGRALEVLLREPCRPNAPTRTTLWNRPRSLDAW
jgi:hypothetical protein